MSNLDMDTQLTEPVAPEMETVWDAVRPQMVETGGVCAEGGCNRSAPYVVMGGKKIPMRCPEHAEIEQRRADEAEHRRLAEHYLPRAGITERLRGFTFETYRRECGDAEGLRSLAVVEDWTEQFLRGEKVPNLLLYGEWGNGKTGLAISAIRAICEHGTEAKLVNFKELLDEMKDQIARKEPAVQALGVHRVPVLALDDLGSERATAFAAEQLLGIVNYRYEYQRPTIYISNYDPDKLAQMLGATDPVIGHRIVSRMVDGAIQHRLRAQNRRRPLAA